MAFAAAFTRAGAQSGWPDRAITIVHGSGPGGNADVLARLVGERLAVRLGQPVVVDTRQGAGGTTSAAYVARAPADGYTLTVLTGGHAVSAAIYKKLPYDSVEAFTWITILTEFPFVFATYPDHPARTIAELVAGGRTRTTPLLFATSGIGTGQHLAAELFSTMAELPLQHVPYRTASQVVADVLGKRVDFMVETPTAVLELVKTGQVRALAVTGARRFFSLPDVPAIAEATVPGYVVTSLLGLAGPAGLPAAVVSRLNTEVRAILAEPEIVARIHALGSEPRPTSPEEFRARMVEDVAKWTKVVADAHIERI